MAFFFCEGKGLGPKPLEAKNLWEKKYKKHPLNGNSKRNYRYNVKNVQIIIHGETTCLACQVSLACNFKRIRI